MDHAKESDRELFNPVKKSLMHKPIYINNPLARMGAIFNIQPEQYILLGSNTSTGKTSLLDHFILSIIESKPEHIHYEVLYYSMERKKRFKYAKWVSWKLKQKGIGRMSSNTIMNLNGKLTKEKLNRVEAETKSWLDDTLDYIDLREGPKTLESIESDINRLAIRLGDYYHSDHQQVYKNGKAIAKFKEDQFITTRYGKKCFLQTVINGEKYTIYQNDNFYISKKPTIVWIVLDHIGKIVSSLSKKEALDKLDKILSNARDKYSFCPVPVSQFNRSVGATDRQKFNKGDLTPIMEDFKDTGNLTESADIVMSLFDPARYKSWNAQGEYKGYDIRDAMITPTGQQRARSLHILKNSFGYANVAVMLRFTGESMYFESMPPITDVAGIAKIYKEISEGK